ncbi:MAG TPA: hypothetical protein VFX38_01455 [Gammaproteobacteria bacterium]|nr:hypothetical protein [Gammaproteobacteria bacterium]
MHFDTADLIASVIFGSLGSGYLLYGRRAERPAFLIAGAALVIFPWFVTNLVLLIAIGAALLLAAPFAAWWFEF